MAESQIVNQEYSEEPQIQMTEEGFSRNIQFEISRALLNRKLSEEIKQYKDKVNVPGFRKGKAPISVIINRLPEEETLDFLRRIVKDKIDNHLSESDKIVLGAPNVKTDFSDKDGMVAKVKVNYEVCPDIPDIDFSQYNLVKFIPQDRTQLLEQIREDFLSANPERVPQERGYKAENGDFMKVDLTVDAPETTADGFVDRGRELLVEENSSIFGEKFNSIGLELDEEFTVDARLPSFYENYEFAGHPCKFHFKVLEIFKNKILDEPTLEMVKKFGFSSIEELDEVLLERKLQQFESISTNILRKQFAYTMKEELSFDVPNKVLNTTMEDIWHERKLASTQKDEDNPVEANQEVEQNDNDSAETDIEDTIEVDWTTVEPDEVAEIKTLATKGVRYLILLKDLAKKENIKTTREEILDDWSLYLSRNYKSDVYDPNRDRSKLKFEDIPEIFVINSQHRITLSKVETFILDKVGATERKISFKKLMELREKETFENFQEFLNSNDLVQEGEVS